MAEIKKLTKQYEGMFLFGSSAASEVEKSLGIVRSLVEKHGATVLVLKKWDERKLSYEIQGQKRGLYVLCYFAAPTTAMAAIEREVNLSEDILRVLITDAEHLNQDEMAAVEPQPIQPREERSPWDRPGFNDDFRRPRRDERPREERGRDEKSAAAPSAAAKE